MSKNTAAEKEYIKCIKRLATVVAEQKTIRNANHAFSFLENLEADMKCANASRNLDNACIALAEVNCKI